MNPKLLEIVKRRSSQKMNPNNQNNPNPQRQYSWPPTSTLTVNFNPPPSAAERLLPTTTPNNNIFRCMLLPNSAPPSSMPLPILAPSMPSAQLPSNSNGPRIPVQLPPRMPKMLNQAASDYFPRCPNFYNNPQRTSSFVQNQPPRMPMGQLAIFEMPSMRPAINVHNKQRMPPPSYHPTQINQSLLPVNHQPPSTVKRNFSAVTVTSSNEQPTAKKSLSTMSMPSVTLQMQVPLQLTDSGSANAQNADNVDPLALPIAARDLTTMSPAPAVQPTEHDPQELLKINKLLKSKVQELNKNINAFEALQSNHEKDLEKIKEEIEKKWNEKKMKIVERCKEELAKWEKESNEAMEAEKKRWKEEMAKNERKWNEEMAEKKGQWKEELAEKEGQWKEEMAAKEGQWKEELAEKEGQWKEELAEIKKQFKEGIARLEDRNEALKITIRSLDKERDDAQKQWTRKDAQIEALEAEIAELKRKKNEENAKNRNEEDEAEDVIEID